MFLEIIGLVVLISIIDVAHHYQATYDPKRLHGFKAHLLIGYKPSGYHVSSTMDPISPSSLMKLSANIQYVN